METNRSSSVEADRLSAVGGIGLLSHWQAAATCLALLLAAYVLQAYFWPDPNRKLPYAGGDDLNARWTQFLGEGSWELYREGYQKFKGRAFKVTDGRKRDKLVLPHTMLPELAKYPDEVLSNEALAAEVQHTNYTIVDSAAPVFKRVLLSQLTPALARVTPALQEEVIETTALELPNSSEWTETTILDKLLNIVAMSSGRIFIGPECCRDPTYINGSTNFITDLASATSQIRKLPRLLRPVLAPRLPITKLVRRRMRQFVDILEPVIWARKKAAEEQSSDYQKPDDMTQWMIDTVDKVGHKEVVDIAMEQTVVSFSAVNSTAQFTSLAIFALAADPELAPMLLEDVNQALKKSGGEWTNLALQDMKKLDSFLMEIGRYQPFTAYSFGRKVTSPITLSNGMRIPKGANIEVGRYGVTQDPEIYPEPEKFDALRFYRIRQDKDGAAAAAKTSEAATQFVNVTPTHLIWNYGRRACPGRFFATNLIKLILATLLLRYEVRNAAGVEGRAKNIFGLGMQFANPENKIQIRRK